MIWGPCSRARRCDLCDEYSTERRWICRYSTKMEICGTKDEISKSQAMLSGWQANRLQFRVQLGARITHLEISAVTYSGGCNSSPSSTQESTHQMRYIPFQARVCSFVHMACQMCVSGMGAGNKCSSHLIELILEEIKNTCIGEKGMNN